MANANPNNPLIPPAPEPGAVESGDAPQPAIDGAVTSVDPAPTTGEENGSPVYDPYGTFERMRNDTTNAETPEMYHETSDGVYDPYGDYAQAQRRAAQ